MELHRMVFRVDFPFAFKLISAWAEVLELLQANKHWTGLGETLEPRRIAAEHKDLEKGQNDFLFLEVSNFSGNFEAHPIESPEPYESVLRDVSVLTEKLGIASFIRIGTRFSFLEPIDSFENAQKALASRVGDEYWKQLDGDLIDMSITSVHKHEDQNMRLNVGPISKKEYPIWFGMPDKVAIESAFLFDIDCYSMQHKFKTFDFRKVMDFNYTKARKQALKLSDSLKN
jgi:hypothetical protein